MSEEMKPCPFCGGEAKMHAAFAHGVASRVGVYVECGSCGAWSKTQWGDGAQGKAADAWNRRAERTCRVEVERRKLSQTQTAVVKTCSECGFEYGVETESTFPFEVTVGAVEPPNFCPNCGAKVVER